MIRRLLLAIVPVGLRPRTQHLLNSLARRLKSPKMLWGYLDSSGNWNPRTRISDSTFIYCPDQIKIEDNVYIGHFTILDGTGGIEIGEGTQISSWAGVYSHSSHIAIRLYGKHYYEVPEDKKRGFRIAPVKLGRYVFVGVGAIVLSGVTVGDGALVAPRSIVRGNVDPFAVVSGDPAEVVGDTRDIDRKYLDDPQIKSWYEEWQNDIADGS